MQSVLPEPPNATAGAEQPRKSSFHHRGTSSHVGRGPEEQSSATSPVIDATEDPEALDACLAVVLSDKGPWSRGLQSLQEGG